MPSELLHLALEVKYLEPARAFYESTLGLAARTVEPGEVALGAGPTDLILRTPGPVPRGGLHTHFAFSIPAPSYDDWYDRLSAEFDLDEHRFGDVRSLYCYDPDGNCVELGQDRGTQTGREINGIFEVVLEVESLPRAEAFYTTIGFETVDRGSGRRRVRLSDGPLDLELWEPHLGLADARGGVHVDFGLRATEPTALAERVADDALAIHEADAGVRIRDPDGHWLTLTTT